MSPFATPRFPGHCAACDAPLISTCPTCQSEQGTLRGYRRVHFLLSDGSETFVSFCQACASQPWTAERLLALTEQCQEGWVRGGWEPGAALRVVRPLPRPAQVWAEVQ